MKTADLKLLTQIATLASNLARFEEAQLIIDALSFSGKENESAIALNALNQINQKNFEQAIQQLKPWCDENDTCVSHSLLALAYWQNQQLEEAVDYCKRIVNTTNEEVVLKMVSEIINQIRESI